MKLGEALAAQEQILRENSIASPRLTAEVLLAQAIGTNREFLYAHSDDALGEKDYASYRSTILRRSSGEPLQYITGVQEFYGRPFEVDASVFIPRPETEFVVEAVTDLNRWPHPRIVDVGTGSGCIATTLSLELPGARVLASDVSLSALGTARRNAARLGAPLLFACMDRLTAWRGPFEIIASNPPYVALEERRGLQTEVRDFEPALALFGEGDPIGFYRELLAQARERLVDGGLLVVEIGYSMEYAVRALFAPPWRLLPTRRDLQGIPRVIAALRG